MKTTLKIKRILKIYDFNDTQSLAFEPAVGRQKSYFRKYGKIGKATEHPEIQKW